MEPTANPVVELEDVAVDYGAFRALKGVSLRLPAGATGLVGRNGAGKSTLLRLLLGLLAPTAGRGQVLGVELRSAGATLRRQVGYMPENDALLPGFRGLEQVVLAGELCGLSSAEAVRRAHETLAYTGLGEARYRPVEQYSSGMKQRLKLAVALVHDPPLLLLDEPTVGLDPPGRRRMLDLIADLVATHRKSAIVCTHLLSDIERTCEYVVMLEAGAVLTAGTMDDLAGGLPDCYRLEWQTSGDNGKNDDGFGRALERLGGRWLDGPPKAVERRWHQAPTFFLRIAMPAKFDARRFFQTAHEHQVCLQLLEPETAPLAEEYYRLLGEQEAGDDA